ncbi:MAG: di-heme oxidoredictase family protein, partial [Planctomycetota bacterium]|nr:di-heme oxidoredictase family protein [Planctomycetota bacterium]
GQFVDGTPYSLESPSYALTNLNYGPLDPSTMLSPRVAQPVFGLGLLETISEVDILANADENDADNDGISGRANRVTDVTTQQLVLGRFGWKASQPTVLQQSAAAFNGDIGLTTNLFPNENTTASQGATITAPSGGSPEINDQILNDTSFYISTLAVPARRNVNDPSVQRGEQLFKVMNCDSCHVADFTTGQNAAIPELSNQSIHPYTDLLLHDMGAGLADGRPDFLANGQEWRTPPLWGIGLTQTVNGHNRFLHDGRARNLTEAILWHGGEGESSKEQFRGLSAAERAD